MPGAALAGGTLLLGLVVLAGCPLPAPAPPSAPLQAQAVQAPPSPLERGEAIFLRSCAGCHGEEGRGDGAASAYLFPKPRDFSRGAFKLTSTPNGSLPTDEDLFRTVTNGMPGSAMPSWELLSENDRWAVVSFVKSLTRSFDEEEGKWVNYYDLGRDMTPVIVPPGPARTVESVARGKIVYRKAECWKCHGEEGRGDGPSAPTLKDDWGWPIEPRDYTAGIFKGGDDPGELFKRVTIGMNGTPMPSHDSALTPSQRWDVVHYLQSIARPGAQERARQIRRTILARRVPPSPDWGEPAAPGWEELPGTYVALMPLWWRNDRVEGLLVRAAHDGQALLLHVTWEDRTRNAQAVRAGEFRDAVAVQFALKPDAPFFAMGALGEEVNLWLWKADREGGPGSYPDVETAYPNAAVMDYPETADWKPGERDAAKRPLRGMGARFAPGWAAGNPVSDPDAASPVENLAAHGFSTLSPLPSVSTRVRGRGVHDRGVWSVVFRRDLGEGEAREAPLIPGRRVPVAFAAWDGSAGDRNGQKSITIWHDLEIAW